MGNFRQCAAVLAFLFLSVGVCSAASAQEVTPSLGFLRVSASTTFFGVRNSVSDTQVGSSPTIAASDLARDSTTNLGARSRGPHVTRPVTLTLAVWQ